MADCECDKYLHENKKCDREAEEYENIKVSPALCIRCLNYCYNDEDDE